MSERRTIDLDKARAARAEAQSEAVVVVFKGETFELAPELAWETLRAWASDPYEGFRLMFGDEDFERFRKLEPTADDVNELSDGIVLAYGLGEATE